MRLRNWFAIILNYASENATSGDIHRLNKRSQQDRPGWTVLLTFPDLGGILRSMARFKVVAVFLVAWLAAAIFWGFLTRALGLKPDNPAVEGLASTGVL